MFTISTKNWSPWAVSIAKKAVKYSPQITGVAGMLGFWGAIAMTYRNAKDIHEGIEERDWKKVAKKSAGPIGLGVVSTIMEGCSMKTFNNRLISSAAGYAVLDTAYSELKEQVKNTVGEKKASAVEENTKIAKVQKALDNSDLSIIEETGQGNELCCELLTGRLFKSDVVSIKAAINAANEAFDNGEDAVSLGDLHYHMGLDPCQLDRVVYWHRDCSRIKADIDATVINNQTVITIDYRRYGFTNRFGDFERLPD